ncbi:MAG: gamma-glutamylcyclotransferase family protein, partial [Patescibacteria group bacterium]
NRVTPKIGSVIDKGAAKLSGYKIVFNKLSTDKSGKTNIIQDEEAIVWGVIYELAYDQIERLDRIEKGYKRIPIVVDYNNEQIEVDTYLATEDYVQENLFPTTEYLELLIQGAKEHNFPQDYQVFLENITCVSK